MTAPPANGLRTWLLPLTVVALSALLPAMASAVRPAPPPGCATDGVVLREPPAARLTEAGGGSRGFCSIGCARRWLAAMQTECSALEVRDESTDTAVSVQDAHFAWSPVVAQPATGDRTHAFAREEDAARHVEFFRGRLLTGAEHPFHAFPLLRKGPHAPDGEEAPSPQSRSSH